MARKGTKAEKGTKAGEATKAVQDTKGGKAKTAFTEQEKLDRHKRAEKVRRNMIASAKKKVMAWVPEEFKLNCHKTNNLTESLEAANNWLGATKADNDELENTYKALLEAHGLIDEGYLMAQTQLQEQQQQYQQQLQLPTPPSKSPPRSQPAVEANSVQEATPPTQPNQFTMTAAEYAEYLFQESLRVLVPQHQPPPSGA